MGRHFGRYRQFINFAICHVHKDVLNKLNMNDLMKEFIVSKESRVAVLGVIWNERLTVCSL